MSATASKNGTLPRDARAAAVWALARGIQPVPIPPKKKGPVLGGWQNLRVTAAEVDAVFAPDGNIGALNGAPSGGQIDVDLDTADAIRAADVLLPATDMVSGRQSAPTSHRWYRVDDPPAKAAEAFDDPVPSDQGGVGRIVELRSTGSQTVLPPSCYGADPAKGHPNEEPCVWYRHGDPAAVTAADLSAAVGAVAAAALLGTKLPKSKRHDCFLALAGGLMRAWQDEERVLKFCEAVYSAAGDREDPNDERDRQKCVETTVQRLRDGKGKTTGWPELKKLLGVHGDAIVDAVCDWLGVTFEKVAAEYTATPTPTPPPWPAPPGEEAFHGLAGDIVRAIDQYTEADKTAILAQALFGYGNIIGRNAYSTVEATKHYTNEFGTLVGQTGKARKGTSWGQIHSLYLQADPLPEQNTDEFLADEDELPAGWAATRVMSGLSSGEGAIWQVRDPIEKQERVKVRGEATRYETVIADPGVRDKRLFVQEPEFANVLKQADRQGNTLSAILRQAWESGCIRTLTKNSPAKATGAHVSILGHITAEELTRYLSQTEMANGFGNRFWWFCVRRSKLLPDGGQPDPGVMKQLAGRLAEAVLFGKQKDREMRRDDSARSLWRDLYPVLSRDRPGLAGHMLGRAEAHTLRLSMIYALLDRSAVITAAHLMAAVALWDYAERSVLHIFGDTLGDPLADDLLRFIRTAGSAGVNKTDLINFLGRHTSADRVNRALGVLLAHGLAHPVENKTNGRPEERWFPGPPPR